MKKSLTETVVLVSAAIASVFERPWSHLNLNLNFASPSRRHTSLGIDVPHVQRRSWKRGSLAYHPSELRFTHGVASGDPWPESVILWTRVAPSNESDESTVVVNGTAPLYSHETDKYVQADRNPICVEWNVFINDPSKGPKNTIVSRGKTYTTSDIDYTVKVSHLGYVTFGTRLMNRHYPGRSCRPQALDYVLLPVQCLWLKS